MMIFLRRAGVTIAILLVAAGLFFRATACVKVDDPSLLPAFDAAQALPPPPKPQIEPNPERNLFFGDLHIHTALSADAYTFGVRAMPDDAYVFARGGTIEHGAGYPIRIDRPLDFAAVTDHSETIGIVRASNPDLPLTRRPLRDLLLNGTRFDIQRAWAGSITGIDTAFSRPENGIDVIRSAWKHVIEAAERHNRPGEFTSFIGYEWSSGKNRGHLHRNVIYRGSSAPDLPFSSADSPDPEGLWAALAEQSTQGMVAMSIPHNPNLSNGSAYEPNTFEGGALDANYAERRNRWERVSEILQVKGGSETHPILSTEDEFADFEIHHMRFGFGAGGTAEEELAILKGSYARAALRAGLEFSSERGFNPFRFGVIGSSDSHNASSTPNESSHHGKLPMLDGSAAIRLGTALLLRGSVLPATQWGSGGLAAIWAEENTRASLFDSLYRRETYATSGPRIALRFFGGWSLEDDLAGAEDAVARAYAQGVPMGGDLPARGGASAPRFAVWAGMDPEGAHLDRIQIVKGWVDSNGESHERIYDVAASDERTPAAGSNQVAALPSTVDLSTASYTNSVGATWLGSVWEDPDFDPLAPAFYYARVLEITTPRWSTFDAVRLGVAPPEPSTLQERAVSSAIWYSPN